MLPALGAGPGGVGEGEDGAARSALHGARAAFRLAFKLMFDSALFLLSDEDDAEELLEVCDEHEREW